MTLKLQLVDDSATRDLGKALAESLPADVAGWTILLRGELGAGKSTLARALLQSLGHAGPVPSPTYTLVEPYEVSGRKIYHIDLYRVSDASELDFLGLDDLADGLKMVEWPERAESLAGSADLLIELALEGSGRAARVTELSPRAAPLMANLSANPVFVVP